jgi:hypothetical protein
VDGVLRHVEIASYTFKGVRDRIDLSDLSLEWRILEESSQKNSLGTVASDVWNIPALPLIVQYSACSSRGFEENVGVIGFSFGQRRA